MWEDTYIGSKFCGSFIFTYPNTANFSSPIQSPKAVFGLLFFVHTIAITIMTTLDYALLSKTVSFGLRHRPQDLGLTLDKEGWCSVNDLLVGLAAHGLPLTLPQLHDLVARSDKKRFALSDDGARIRANQGHTTKSVELTFQKKHPPATLYHGTIERFLPAIFKSGLSPMKRHHVHLSADVASATAVGGRRGEAVILEVSAGDLALSGQEFFLSENGVWLTASVPAKHLRRLDAV